MATDPHTPLPLEGPLNDRKPTDRMAAKWLIIVVATLLVVFAVVASFIHKEGQVVSPTQQEQVQ